MRPFDLILIAGILIAGGMSLANKPEAARPSPDCQCVDCTCDPCECGPVVVTPDEPEPEPPKPEPKTGRYFMFFTQRACPSCPAMHRLAKQLEAEGHYLLVVDAENEPALAAKYGVASTPQFLVYDRETRQFIRRTIGTTTREQLLNEDSTPAATNQQRITGQEAYRQPAMRQTGWIRGGRVFNACGPGGCG